MPLIWEPKEHPQRKAQCLELNPRCTTYAEAPANPNQRWRFGGLWPKGPGLNVSATVATDSKLWKELGSDAKEEDGAVATWVKGGTNADSSRTVGTGFGVKTAPIE